MTRLTYHLLLLALCRRTAVRGFGLLPPLLSSQSRGGVTKPYSNNTPRSSCRRVDRVMMAGAFWEGIVQGIGMKTPTPQTAKEKCPVLICPAQLSVPGDYRQMVTELKARYGYTPTSPCTPLVLGAGCGLRSVHPYPRHVLLSLLFLVCLNILLYSEQGCCRASCMVIGNSGNMTT